jgi:hypothetical protein
LALAHVYGFLPRADEEPTSSMERWGRQTGVAHWDGSFRPRGTSLSWQGRRTAQRKTNGNMPTGPPPCRTSPSRKPSMRQRRGYDRDEEGGSWRRG